MARIPTELAELRKNALQDWMKNFQFTRGQAASKLQVSEEIIGKWLAGKQAMSATAWKKLQTYLDYLPGTLEVQSSSEKEDKKGQRTKKQKAVTFEKRGLAYCKPSLSIQAPGTPPDSVTIAFTIPVQAVADYWVAKKGRAPETFKVDNVLRFMKEEFTRFLTS